MLFPSKPIKGTLVKRYKRFLADIDLGGETITAHCANTGSMMGVKDEGASVWVTKASNPKRKLSYDWQVIEVAGARVCINTASANKIVEEALRANNVPELTGYERLRREVKYGENSRIDFLLEDDVRGLCYVEVKNVTLSRNPPLAEFPDSPTARGTKHLKELAAMAKAGHRAVMFYLVNRTDCTHFSLAEDVDPDYAEECDKARQAGVEIMAFRAVIDECGVRLGEKIALSI